MGNKDTSTAPCPVHSAPKLANPIKYSWLRGAPTLAGPSTHSRARQQPTSVLSSRSSAAPPSHQHTRGEISPSSHHDRRSEPAPFGTTPAIDFREQPELFRRQQLNPIRNSAFRPPCTPNASWTPGAGDVPALIYMGVDENNPFPEGEAISTFEEPESVRRIREEGSMRLRAKGGCWARRAFLKLKPGKKEDEDKVAVPRSFEVSRHTNVRNVFSLPMIGVTAPDSRPPSPRKDSGVASPPGQGLLQVPDWKQLAMEHRQAVKEAKRKAQEESEKETATAAAAVPMEEIAKPPKAVVRQPRFVEHLDCPSSPSRACGCETPPQGLTVPGTSMQTGRNN